MMIIRPIRTADIDAIVDLAREAGHGMSNLPADRDELTTRIRISGESLERAVEEPSEEFYLFVLEDRASGRIVGTSGIMCGIGRSRPFYSYKIIKRVHTSRAIGRSDTARLLQIVNEYHGVTEIGALYLTPGYRRGGFGKLLSRSRYLFLAEHPERFTDPVMAEMRGVIDDQGHSVFWDSLGRCFLHMDFSRADYLHYRGNFQIIVDLLPEYPVYTRLLPEEAQAVIGLTHPETVPALELLKREGFRFEGCINVFDGGPQLHVPRELIRTVRESDSGTITRIVDRCQGATHLVANTKLQDYRVCQSPLARSVDDEIAIEATTATALEVDIGDRIRFVPGAASRR